MYRRKLRTRLRRRPAVGLRLGLRLKHSLRLRRRFGSQTRVKRDEADREWSPHFGHVHTAVEEP